MRNRNTDVRETLFIFLWHTPHPWTEPTGMWPDWGLNPRPFREWDEAETHQLRHTSQAITPFSFISYFFLDMYPPLIRKKAYSERAPGLFRIAVERWYNPTSFFIGTVFILIFLDWRISNNWSKWGTSAAFLLGDTEAWWMGECALNLTDWVGTPAP